MGRSNEGDFNRGSHRQLWIARTAIIVLALPATASAQFTQAPNSPFGAGASPSTVATGDFNNDGILDLVIVNGKAVTVMLGIGNGEFMAPSQFVPPLPSPFPATLLPNSPSCVAVGHFNGGGNYVAITDLNTETVTVLMSPPAGQTGAYTAASGSPFQVGQGPVFVTTGNFNGSTGLAVANSLDDTVSVYLYGQGGFSEATGSPFKVGVKPMAIAVGNFNGYASLAVANEMDGTVSVLLGNGQGGFMAAPNPFPVIVAPPNPNATRPYPVSVAVGDFNGDGIPDIVTANQGTNDISLLLGNPQGGFTPAAGSPFTVAYTGMEPVAVAVTDFNLDGYPDLVIVNYQSDNVMVLLGNGKPVFTPSAANTYTVGTSPHSVAIGDFNGDGKPDMAIANEGENSVSVLLNSIYVPVMVSAATEAISPTGAAVVAPGSIVSIWGSGMASGPNSATTTPPPVTLGGTSVTITDSKQVQTPLPLFYVSSGQINAQIPATAATGMATFTVFTGSGNQTGAVTLNPTAPGLFTANPNGEGVANGQFVALMPNGFQSVTNVYQCPGGPGTCTAVPLNVSSGSDPTLVLYGTGICNYVTVTGMCSGTAVATIVGNGVNTQIANCYVGSTALPGVDQVNVPLTGLGGSGAVRVTVTVAGMVSNGVTIYIQ